MAKYKITTHCSCGNLRKKVIYRKRIDSACLQFEKAVYAMIKANANLDTLAGRRAYNEGQSLVIAIKNRKTTGVIGGYVELKTDTVYFDMIEG